MITAHASRVSRPIGIGERVRVRLPHSEVMVHMGLAGKVYEVMLAAPRSGGAIDHSSIVALVLNDRGCPFTTVLPSEAGVFSRSDGTHYVYPEAA